MRRQALLNTDQTRRICGRSWTRPSLRRPLGGGAVMRRQLQHLLEMTELPHVTLQVVPFKRGGHAAAGGPFSILRFADRTCPTWSTSSS